MVFYRFVFIISLFIAAFLTSCTPARQPTPTLHAVLGLSSGNPELTLELSKNTYKSGEPITGMLTLRNTGDSELLVNGRMAPNEQTAPERLRDIVFSIFGRGFDSPRLHFCCCKLSRSLVAFRFSPRLGDVGVQV